MIFITKEDFKDQRSEFSSAIIFGKISAKITTKVVITNVAIITPTSPNKEINKLVANTEARIFTRLLPTKRVLIKVSCLAISFSNAFALLSPSSAKCLILALDIAVNAVSDPEKKAEIINNPRIEPINIPRVVSIYLNPTDIKKLLISVSLTSS